MINQAVYLAHKLYEDKAVIEHCRRAADRAILAGCDEKVVAGCYLHEVLTYNYTNYYDIVLQIKEIDENLAKIVEKCTKKNESWKEFYYRVSLVPEVAIIMWFCMTDAIIDTNYDDFKRISSNLERIYKKTHNI